MNRRTAIKAGLVMIGGLWVPKQHGATIIVRGPRTPAVASGTPFFTGTPSGSPRNDFSGFVGCKLTNSSGSAISITHLARWVLSGNSGTHTVAIRNTSGTILDSVSVNTSGEPVGWKYVALTSAYSWSNGATICITSTETNAGDTWYDSQAITYASIGVTLDFSVYETTGTPTDFTADQTYVPVNFRF